MKFEQFLESRIYWSLTLSANILIRVIYAENLWFPLFGTTVSGNITESLPLRLAPWVPATWRNFIETTFISKTKKHSTAAFWTCKMYSGKMNFSNRRFISLFFVCPTFATKPFGNFTRGKTPWAKAKSDVVMGQLCSGHCHTSAIQEWTKMCLPN